MTDERERAQATERDASALPASALTTDAAQEAAEGDGIVSQELTAACGRDVAEGDVDLAESGVLTGAAEEISVDAVKTAVTAEDEHVTETAAGPESAEEGGDEEERIDSGKLMRFSANPMFAHFARGRRDGIAKICRDFEAMLAAGGYSDCGDVGMMAKMTPSVGAATPEVALSDQQRALARAAGMSYREYYELIRALPDRMPKSNETYKQKMP